MQKGFNLFTALVATILVVIAVLLTQQMTRTERSTTDIINNIEEEQKMLAVADLAKADALQVFNFGIRFAIEEWLTTDSSPADGVPDNYYLLTPDVALQPDAWERIKKDFARTHFGLSDSSGRDSGTQLATLASNHLTDLLLQAPDVKGYSIDLPEPNRAELRTLLQKVFDESSKSDDFFKVVECDGTIRGCAKGTFYVNLNLKRPQDGGYLTDEEYEKFPQLTVKNNITERVLRQPILPRGNLQIYVPLRLFKGLAYGLEVASTGDEGIFKSSSQVHQQIDGGYGQPGAASGICDSDCSARENPLAEAFGQLTENSCFGDPFTVINQLGPIDFGNGDFLVSYNPGDSREQSNTLKQFVESQVIKPNVDSIAEQKQLGEGDFKLVKISPSAVTVPRVSRYVFSKKSSTKDEKVADAYCTKVQEVSVTLVFEEANDNFIVAKRGDRKNIYGIRLSDDKYRLYPEGSIRTCTTEYTKTDLQDEFFCQSG